MKDFKSYNGNGGNNGKSGNYGDNGANNAANSPDSAINMATNIARAMNGKNERQILAAILAEAERGKRAGTLSNDDIDRFYNALAPTLDGVKKRKLKEVVERLKSI